MPMLRDLVANGERPPLLFPKHFISCRIQVAFRVRSSTCTYKEKVELIVIPRMLVNCGGSSL